MLAVSFPAEHVSKQRLLGVGGLFRGIRSTGSLARESLCLLSSLDALVSVEENK